MCTTLDPRETPSHVRDVTGLGKQVWSTLVLNSAHWKFNEL